MADVVIVNNDQIQITINPPCLVPGLSAPVPLVASGFATVNDQAVCIVGDELPPSLKAPMAYTSGAFVTPGMGTVSVTLKSANKTQTTTDVSNVVLLKGQTFDAKFQVSVPAQQPSPTGPVPDPTSSYSGTAQFISTDTVATSD